MLIAVCMWVYFVVQPSVIAGVPSSREAQLEDLRFTVGHAAIPCEVINDRLLTINEIRMTFGQGNTEACSANPTGPPATPEKHIYWALFYSMFLHGGLLHLAGNMIFLWVFGNNVEDRMGHVRYLLFYLIGGLIATIGHILAQPNSTVPLVGASGAIAAVMGAYLVLFPNVRVTTWAFFIIVSPKAKWFLVFWFISQFFINPNEGVAWVAHVVGFLFGIAIGTFFLGRRPSPPPPPAGEAPVVWSG